MKLNVLDWIAIILVVIGAINWGLVGWLDYNLIDSIFGVSSTLARIIYAVVGVAGLWVIYTVTKSNNQ